MTDIPKPTPPFAGRIGRLIHDSEGRPLQKSTPPAQAPNILLILLDDVGFGSCSTFGGPVPTPAVDRIAEILRQHGYSTACFGKWQMTPSREYNRSGPFEHWPTGMGFERFYGIWGGEASPWEPALYDQIRPVTPYVNRPNYHLSEDLADKAIEWLQRHRSSVPN